MIKLHWINNNSNCKTATITILCFIIQTILKNLRINDKINEKHMNHSTVEGFISFGATWVRKKGTFSNRETPIIIDLDVE